MSAKNHPVPSPEEKEQGRTITARQTVQATTFAGPLPPPSILERYDQILPGAADRILSMAERQAAHRQDLEKTVIEGDSRRSITGMYLGFSLCLVCIFAGSLLIWLGKSTEGLTTLLFPLAGLVSAFGYGQISRRKEREAHIPRPVDASGHYPPQSNNTHKPK